MKKLRKYWLEIIFLIFIIVIIFLSAKNSFHMMKIDYGKELIQKDADLGTLPMDKYLAKIQENSGWTSIIVVKDIQGYYTTAEIIQSLKNMGFDQADILLEEQYHSFIGIWSNGQAIYQQVGGDEAIFHGQFVGEHYIFAKSATWSSGNTGEIYLDDIPYSVNNRGFNIVTIDNTTNELVDSVAYDVYIKDIPLYRIVNGNIEMIDSTIKE